MTTTKCFDHGDKVVRIIRTYGDLPLGAEALTSFRQDTPEAHWDGHGRLPEDEAAVFLARYLHAMVVAELGSGIDSSTVSRVLGAWSKFAQQAMYRADLGLINLVLFNDEILPHINEVERILRERSPANTNTCALSAS